MLNDTGPLGRSTRIAIGTLSLAGMIILPMALGGGYAAAADDPAASASRDDTIWTPAVGTSWWWQIENTAATDVTIDADVFDVDLFGGGESGKIAELRGAGKRVICYFSAGTYEPYRPDADDFTANALISDATLPEFSDETWLNIGDEAALEQSIKPVMRARMDLAQSLGCDAVEPDNVDGYANGETQGRISADDQLAYNRWLAGAAHERGLSVGLKNNVEQVPALVSEFDFAINEQCYAFDNECVAYESTFLAAGKAVFSQEYGSNGGGGGITESEFTTAACPYFKSQNISSLWKQALNVDGQNVTVCELDESTSGVSTLPSLTLPTGEWSQIALPGDPGTADTVADIFDELSAAGYGTDWVVFGYDRSTGGEPGYTELSLASPMSQGDGYWVVQSEKPSVDIAMPDGSQQSLLTNSAQCASAAGCVEIPLRASATSVTWNLAGFPLGVNASVASSRIGTASGSCLPGCTFANAEVEGVVLDTLYHYNPGTGGYEALTGSASLEPWDGTWVATLGGTAGLDPTWLVASD